MKTFTTTCLLALVLVLSPEGHAAKLKRHDNGAAQVTITDPNALTVAYHCEPDGREIVWFTFLTPDPVPFDDGELVEILRRPGKSPESLQPEGPLEVWAQRPDKSGAVRYMLVFVDGPRAMHDFVRAKTIQGALPIRRDAGPTTFTFRMRGFKRKVLKAMRWCDVPDDSPFRAAIPG